MVRRCALNRDPEHSSAAHSHSFPSQHRAMFVMTLRHEKNEMLFGVLFKRAEKYVIHSKLSNQKW